MKINNVLHYLGLVIAIVGGFMLIPFIFSLINAELDQMAFGISIVITLSAGFLLWRFTPITERRISLRESLAIVAGSWIMAALFGSLPFIISGVLPSVIDCIFEAMSGLTTTGASVFSSVENLPHGILVWRSLTQWIGGLGIIMLFVTILPMLGIGASQLMEAETPGQQERLTSRIRDTARTLWLLYLGFTVAGFIALVIAGLPGFDAFNVILATTPTGGFAPVSSIGVYNNLAVELILIFFMVASGVNFGLYYYLLWKGRPAKFFGNPEFKLYIGILAGCILLINWDLVANAGIGIFEGLRQASFQTTSVMTTTGFATADFATWPHFSQAILLVLMVVGASAGSTGGGLKVIRLLVLFKYTYRRILLTFNPNAVIPIKIGGNVISDKLISRSVGLTILYFAALWAGFLIMSAIGLDFVTALSSITSCLGNIGPALGTVGPMSSYADIPGIGKLVLLIAMLVGRIELFTLLVLFVPAFWRWR